MTLKLEANGQYTYNVSVLLVMSIPLTCFMHDVHICRNECL